MNALEKAIKLQRRLNALDLDIYVGVLASKSYETKRIEQSLYLKNNVDKGEYNLENKSIEEIIEIAKELAKPTFINLGNKSVCIQLLGKTVYINKEEPKTVKAITVDGLVMTDDNIYPLDECWIKE